MSFDAVSAGGKKIGKSDRALSPEQAAVAKMVAMAKDKGLDLTGPDGLLKLFTKSVLETALNEELTGPPRAREKPCRLGPGFSERAQRFPGEDRDL